MIEPAQETLLDNIRKQNGKVLWIADENSHQVISALAQSNITITVLSNRIDIYQKAKEAGLNAYFSDWDFSEVGSFDCVAFRLCKEKPVNRHIAANAVNCLSENGALLMSGEKNDGIKTFAKEVQSSFSHYSAPKKLGNTYLCQYNAPQKNSAPNLDDYHQLSQIESIGKYTIYSKPGVYGWNKIDQGSALLADHFLQEAKNWGEEAFDSILDLGCGYGYLTFACAELPFTQRIATDNNAAAVRACKTNAEKNNVNLEVIAANCADSIRQRFSRIICNPPFHRGFDVQCQLTDTFLKSARDHLAENGEAYFVVNSFIGIEQKAKKYFNAINTLTNTKQFKVLCLS